PGLLLYLCATALSGQTAQITGRVVDPTGDAVSGARVEVTETGTSQRRTVTTDERGLYAVPLLKPSGYDLTVEKAGFDSIERVGFRLEVGEVARLDFTLKIAGIHELVTVESGAPSLDRETPSLGQVVRGGEVAELPLLGRNTYALGMLVPGVRPAL